MPATSFPWFNTRFTVYVDGFEQPAAGYTLEQYASGTTTPQNTFTDKAGTILNTHPIVLDADGRCTMFGTPGLEYTFVLKDLAGAVLNTWDNIAPFPAETTTAYVPLDGSDPMSGLLTLSGDATSGLNPVSKQQFDAGLAANLSAVDAGVAAATAAAASATAAVANIAPSFVELVSSSGAAKSRTVANMAAGNYEFSLEVKALYVETGGAYTITVSQDGTVSGSTITTSFQLIRSDATGPGRDVYGTKTTQGVFSLAAAGPVTMSLANINLNGTQPMGSRLTVQKV